MLHHRDLPLLAVFAAVARRGSYTQAARELRLAKSVVSDHVRALEERCGVRLFERTSRRLQLTQIGERLLATATAVASAAADVEAILAEHRDVVVGTLRVATTHDLGIRVVIPVAAQLAREHPQLSVEVASDDNLHDLVEGRFDVGVRLGAPKDSGYVMHRLQTVREIIVGAPALLAAWPVARPADLAGAPWARHSLLRRPDVWTFRSERGEEAAVAVVERARANTGEGLRALVLGGAGFAVVPEYLVADDLRRDALRRVCPGWFWKDLALYALTPSGAKVTRRVHVFLDRLRAALGVK